MGIVASPFDHEARKIARRKRREEVEKEYAEALRSAGFFKRLYLRMKIWNEVARRGAMVLRNKW